MRGGGYDRSFLTTEDRAPAFEIIVYEHGPSFTKSF